MKVGIDILRVERIERACEASVRKELLIRTTFVKLTKSRTFVYAPVINLSTVVRLNNLLGHSFGIKLTVCNYRFLDKILTEEEKKYVVSKSDSEGKLPFNTICGLFCLKEAVSKAIGIGLLKGIGFKDIEVLHNAFGAPIVKLSEKAEKFLGEYREIGVSISHDGEYATAFAVIV